MAATLKFVLRRDKRRADGTCPIYLRLIERRRARYLTTGIYVDPKDWNEARQQVRRGHPLAAQINRRLENLRLEVQAALLEGKRPEQVKAELKGGTSRNLVELARRHADRLRAAGKFWAFKQQRVLIHKLEAFRSTLRLEDLTPAVVEEFARFLERRLGNGPSTIRKNLQCLHRVVRYAVQQGLLEPSRDPFLGGQVKLPPERVPYRRRLSFEEIRRLEALELPLPSPPALARDVFLLAFYGAGMRFGDVARLTIDHIRLVEGRPWLHYRMAKTGKLVEVPLPDRALEIVRRWEGPWRPAIFPILRPRDRGDEILERRRISSMNAYLNRVLKEVGRMAAIERPEEVSMHVARHTFADLARRAGDLYAVSKALGHSDLKITQRYLEGFDRQAVERLADRLWNDETP